MKEIFTSETFQMLSDRIDTFMEDHDVYDYDNVTIVVEKVKDETDPAGYIWKATLVLKDTASVLKDLLVENHGIVNMFWSKDDIIELAAQDNRRKLTDVEIDEIARQLANNDCEYGISWQAIRDITLNVCPDVILMDSDEERLSSLINERAKILGRGGDNVDWCMAELMEDVKERIDDGEELVRAIDNSIKMIVLDESEEEDWEDEEDYADCFEPNDIGDKE